MDDLTILAIGRQLIELSIQREQLIQQLKQAQAAAKPAEAKSE